MMLRTVAHGLFVALVLAFLGLPPPVAAEPPACGDFLAEIQAKPEHLEFLECRPDQEAQLRVLKARYRVEGIHAAEVEEYFVRTAGMARLKRNCCGWENWPEKPGAAHDGTLAHKRPLGPEGPTEPGLSIGMSSGEALEGPTRERWGEIPWFYVDAVMYLESP
jgi:hypothetical protein